MHDAEFTTPMPGKPRGAWDRRHLPRALPKAPANQRRGLVACLCELRMPPCICASPVVHCASCIASGPLVPGPRRPHRHLPSGCLVKAMLADQIHPRAVDAPDEGVPANRSAEPLPKAQVQRNCALRRRVHLCRLAHGARRLERRDPPPELNFRLHVASGVKPADGALQRAVQKGGHAPKRARVGPASDLKPRGQI